MVPEPLARKHLRRFIRLELNSRFPSTRGRLYIDRYVPERPFLPIVRADRPTTLSAFTSASREASYGHELDVARRNAPYAM